MVGCSSGPGAAKDFGQEDLQEVLAAARSLKERKGTRAKGEKRPSAAPIDPIRALSSSANVHEALRDVVRDKVRAQLGRRGLKEEVRGTGGAELVKKRREELHELLDNLGDELEGKTPTEVAAILSSFLDIASQLSVTRTDGVICVRCRLASFFRDKSDASSIPPQLRQEVNLIFSPEEVEAVRTRLENMPEEDTMKPFFSMVLDQAFDVVQYNEMTGMILVEMTQHFLDKLDEHGYGNDSKTAEFRERHDRTLVSLNRAIEELRGVQGVINNHLQDFPVLSEFPKALRLLIQVRLGMLPQSVVPQLIETVRSQQAAYARARGSVAFDFNRLPSFQHGVRLRQSAIVNLHRDVLKFTAEQLEGEFTQMQEAFEKLTAEIEAASETLDPDSPEYERLMRQKEMLQKKIAEQRRKLNVVRSQERLVDVQHAQIRHAIERYKEQGGMSQKAQELLEQPKVDPSKVRKQPSVEPKKKVSRMATATLRGGR